jgi:hypothetical protein
MNAADSNTELESADGRSELVAEPVTLLSVVRQVRICRSTLGAILDVLETTEIGSESIERAAERSTDVLGEIEQLWNALRQVPSVLP